MLQAIQQFCWAGQQWLMLQAEQVELLAEQRFFELLAKQRWLELLAEQRLSVAASRAAYCLMLLAMQLLSEPLAIRSAIVQAAGVSSDCPSC
ncbi:hypothetical protein BCR34DRAFT_553256 [Clohesyomyces aquaticus]|uniref:Uncharacterized protein n=1 Tax=Clohesyomyces aquaticus TaxID=1231657 RepID=A0A1Y2A976_9PLEO|nr:hypothetical protein BCR34DRAFT_553256 [Clohesyomyces aquaticus]